MGSGTLSSRVLPLLRLLIVVLVVGIVVMVGALLRYAITNSSNTPRTEAERAIVAAEESVRINPNDPTARIKLAAAYLEQGATSKSLEQARIAVRLSPTDPSPYYVLGLAENEARQYDEAIANLTKATSMEGQLAGFYQDAYFALAHAQEAKGNVTAALTSMDQAIANGPSNTPLLVERAQMFERAKMYYDAAVDYAWALRYVPDYSQAREALDKIKQDHPKDYKRAVDRVANMMAGTKPAGSDDTTTAP